VITALIVIGILLVAVAPPMVLLTLRKDRPPKPPEGGWHKWEDDD
jgi:hypothetical protein